jgi:hypothetical protein
MSKASRCLVKLCRTVSLYVKPLEKTDIKEYDTRLFLKLMLHADNLFHTRINFFLVIETFLFAGMAALGSHEALRRAVALFAAVLTLLIWLMNLNMSAKLHWLETNYEKLDSSGTYREYRDLRKLPLHTIYLFTYALPGLILIGWLIFFFFWVPVPRPS